MNTVESADPTIAEITRSVVKSYVSFNKLSADDLIDVVQAVHTTLDRLSQGAPKPEPRPEPAVPVEISITDDYIICLEDGKKYKSLKRHLAAHYKMTPQQYRDKWGLPANYPMVAPNYSATRAMLARRASGVMD
ncbi:putative transcriptional regulator [Pseudochelatococcus lubricantis]|uniref:Transcriptional regulator n=1 Tax=Pseudochelatococcus lubricantis TaxID=1538102 RepID=A0ABX0UXJ5_9HYPH|nr:MucR family transcriptional regulator [Pseudochelatococcus lubricantis]NIJ56999.1 putative transcriptional regulator [Pseudochelatococcus lubricantis]